MSEFAGLQGSIAFDSGGIKGLFLSSSQALAVSIRTFYPIFCRKQGIGARFVSLFAKCA
jgi:hypothetical protein